MFLIWIEICAILKAKEKPWEAVGEWESLRARTSFRSQEELKTGITVILGKIGTS